MGSSSRYGDCLYKLGRLACGENSRFVFGDLCCYLLGQPIKRRLSSVVVSYLRPEQTLKRPVDINVPPLLVLQCSYGRAVVHEGLEVFLTLLQCSLGFLPLSNVLLQLFRALVNQREELVLPVLQVLDAKAM